MNQNAVFGGLCTESDDDVTSKPTRRRSEVVVGSSHSATPTMMKKGNVGNNAIVCMHTHTVLVYLRPSD